MQERYKFHPKHGIVKITDPDELQSILDEEARDPLVKRAEWIESNREELMADIRVTRNMLLSQSDWTQVKDVNLSEEDISAWATYRQALRNFPSSITDENITDPEWPTDPTGYQYSEE